MEALLAALVTVHGKSASLGAHGSCLIALVVANSKYAVLETTKGLLAALPLTMTNLQLQPSFFGLTIFAFIS